MNLHHELRGTHHDTHVTHSLFCYVIQ